MGYRGKFDDDRFDSIRRLEAVFQWPLPSSVTGRADATFAHVLARLRPRTAEDLHRAEWIAVVLLHIIAIREDIRRTR